MNTRTEKACSCAPKKGATVMLWKKVGGALEGGMVRGWEWLYPGMGSGAARAGLRGGVPGSAPTIVARLANTFRNVGPGVAVARRQVAPPMNHIHAIRDQ